MESIWNDQRNRPQFPALCGDVKTDVFIIGGGMCGILCAYMLKNAGVDCILAEENQILQGVTGRTTAKITVQHGLIYDKIMGEYGEEKAQLYYESQKKALEEYQKLAGEEDDFVRCSSYVYTLQNRAAIEKEVKALERIGCKADFCEKTELPFSTKGAVRIQDQAKFHPLKFGYRLAAGLKIYENTKVLAIQKNTAITENGTIRAKKIIVATHFPFLNKHGAYFLKMYQHRSYVLALKNADAPKSMYVDEAKGGLSFRSHGDVLLLGGGSHRTGEKGGSFTELEEVAKKYYPRAKEVTRWATQDCMTLDGIPYIGRYGKTTPDVYVATGFHKWGMTSSMVSAMLLTDMICGRKSPYEAVYFPSRTMLHSQLAANIFSSAKGLLTPTAPRCPHMGCALTYNRQEHSWDCPCHGSRFDEEGKRLNGPAAKDKKDAGNAL